VTILLLAELPLDKTAKTKETKESSKTAAGANVVKK
jgi:hypothetical protein